MGYTHQASARRSNPAHDATGEAKFKRASSACRHRGGVTIAARSLLAEPRAPGSEATWERVKAKFPDEDQPSISKAATAAVKANVADSEESSGPMWRPEEEFDPQVALEVINIQNALSEAGSDGLSFSHLQSITRTVFGHDKFGVDLEAFWRRIIDDPSTSPPEVWQFFLHSNLTALGETCRPVCVGMAWGRLLAAGTMWQWRRGWGKLTANRDSLGAEYEGGWSK